VIQVNTNQCIFQQCHTQFQENCCLTMKLNIFLRIKYFIADPYGLVVFPEKSSHCQMKLNVLSTQQFH